MTIVAEDDAIQIERLELGPFGTNAYIAICQATRDSVLIDAPAESNIIMDSLKNSGALAELQARLKVPLAAHALDTRNLPSPPEILLSDRDTVSFGNIKFEVFHTPGHTPGSLCFKVGRYLISGDTIFPGGAGKTWSPADFKQIVKSITEKIFVLPDDTQIYPGHGDSTVLPKEKNEFAVFSSRPHNPDLYGDVLWLSS